MPTKDELILHKTYMDSIKYPNNGKKINTKNCVLDCHRELDDEYGFYMKVKVGVDGVYEIWAETVKEYKLWVNFFSKKE